MYHSCSVPVAAKKKKLDVNWKSEKLVKQSITKCSMLMQDKNNHNIEKIIKIVVASWINKYVELRINEIWNDQGFVEWSNFYFT